MAFFLTVAAASEETTRAQIIYSRLLLFETHTRGRSLLSCFYFSPRERLSDGKQKATALMITSDGITVLSVREHVRCLLKARTCLRAHSPLSPLIKWYTHASADACDLENGEHELQALKAV